MMTIYHCNTTEVANPRLNIGSKTGDFGPGFYTTPDLELARSWIQLDIRQKELPTGVISFYDIPIGLMSYSALRVKIFKRPGRAWLDFVLRNRRRPKDAHSYDIVAGPAPDEKAYTYLNAFESGLVSRDELIDALKTARLHQQILFHTAKSLLFLEFSGKEIVACSRK